MGDERVLFLREETSLKVSSSQWQFHFSSFDPPVFPFNEGSESDVDDCDLTS